MAAISFPIGTVFHDGANSDHPALAASNTYIDNTLRWSQLEVQNKWVRKVLHETVLAWICKKEVKTDLQKHNGGGYVLYIRDEDTNLIHITVQGGNCTGGAGNYTAIGLFPKAHFPKSYPHYCTQGATITQNRCETWERGESDEGLVPGDSWRSHFGAVVALNGDVYGNVGGKSAGDEGEIDQRQIGDDETEMSTEAGNGKENGDDPGHGLHMSELLLVNRRGENRETVGGP
ncbi:hypothetical protein H4582DRAFT_2060439 [Lactarius indigo]|nr:hypothetical protein H4582DRAFT_2060439 [Lactarius indigo]